MPLKRFCGLLFALLHLKSASSSKDVLADLTEGEKRVLRGEMVLISLKLEDSVYQDPEKHEESYAGQVVGIFCPVDFTLQKEDPSKAPFYTNLIRSSKCGHKKNQVVTDFHSIVTKMRAADARRNETNEEDIDYLTPDTHVMPPTGFAFHTGRCGSTLFMNSLMALEPDQTRVFNEPRPALQALLACDKSRINCNPNKAANLFRDTIYAMGRTNDPAETRLFLKVLPTSVLAIDIVEMAYPETPWVFLYRDPIHLLVSNMKNRRQKENDNAPGPYCTEGIQENRQVSEFMADVVEREGLDLDELELVDYCALYLGTLIDAALVEAVISSNSLVVNYRDMNADFFAATFQQHFALPVTEEQKETRIASQFGVYSKRMHHNETEAKQGKDDSKEKEKAASDEIKEAAATYIMKSYEKLNLVNTNKDIEIDFPRMLTRSHEWDEDSHEYDPLDDQRPRPQCPAEKFSMSCGFGTTVTPFSFLSTMVYSYTYEGTYTFSDCIPVLRDFPFCPHHPYDDVCWEENLEYYTTGELVY